MYIVPMICGKYGEDHFAAWKQSSCRSAGGLFYGNTRNDYGRGFYCTRFEEIAKEWARKNQNDGFVNRYELDTEGPYILNLSDGKNTVLNWIAIPLKNRTFRLNSPIAIDVRVYLIKHFSIDTTKYDLIIGYRANDSYFQHAESFIESTLPLHSLNKALMLGKMGLQTVLVSENAFRRIKSIDAEPVDKTRCYPKFVEQDSMARQTYSVEIAKSRSYRDDIFELDILREEMRNDDTRYSESYLNDAKARLSQIFD